MSDPSGSTGTPPAGATTPPASTTATPSTPDTNKQTPASEAHFTQSQLDAIVGDRVARERAKYSDYDTLKGQSADREAAIAAAVLAAKDETRAELLAPLVESKAESFAKSLGFHDVNDALATIDKKNLPLKDGKPDDEAIKAAITKLATDKPYLVKAPSQRKTPPGERPKVPEGQNDNGEPKKRTAAEALRELARSKKHLSS